VQTSSCVCTAGMYLLLSILAICKSGSTHSNCERRAVPAFTVVERDRIPLGTPTFLSALPQSPSSSGPGRRHTHGVNTRFESRRGRQISLWTGECVQRYAVSLRRGRSEPAAILVKALLIVWFMSPDATWSLRVALDTVWQSLYLFEMVSLARKMTSERMVDSRFFTAYQTRGSSECAGELQFELLVACCPQRGSEEAISCIWIKTARCSHAQCR
jgi:hypothetical protein